MPTGFEVFVARRYLRAKRKEAVVSIVTVISVVGVAAGVMALIIALAVNNGFRNELQKNLLGATAHVDVLEKETANGIENWEALAAKLRHVPHVIGVSPALYSPVFFQGAQLSAPGVLKGIDLNLELQTTDILKHMKEGSLDRLKTQGKIAGIIMGSQLARSTGMMLDSVITTVSQGEMTPFGPRPNIRPFRAVGIFETGFAQYDELWAFTSLQSAQQALSLPDVVNEIEIKLDDQNLAPQVTKDVQKMLGPKLVATNWIEQNKPLFNAFRIEKYVTIVTIGLIELVAALNILISLVMMVMEKYRDIAILKSMGATDREVMKIFMYQGLVIGVIGTALGAALGCFLCWLQIRYQLVHLNPTVYQFATLPMELKPRNVVIISFFAVITSFISTLYPARQAAKMNPAESLRYE